MFRWSSDQMLEFYEYWCNQSWYIYFFMSLFKACCYYLDVDVWVFYIIIVIIIFNFYVVETWMLMNYPVSFWDWFNDIESKVYKSISLVCARSANFRFCLSCFIFYYWHLCNSTFLGFLSQSNIQIHLFPKGEVLYIWVSIVKH